MAIMLNSSNHDVIVVGAGNAAMCAAIAAAQNGAQVLVLERAPEAERGGNTRFTAGGMRCVYDGLDDLLRSDEHTSELQSLMRSSYAGFCLKKKNKHSTPSTNRPNIRQQHTEYT